ncbi:hypothetical protein [Flaviflexus equikiangi]|uniref:Uncharacterized protein n=1 Tax=Flaviflexus equikiangi TaxID=2758573 RepID=A0ABS2TFH9_9ACTO|nr:hypothetical protein [Flaviflexus equikiangi]MBM9432527.1 hypothetical protein [Flaviflexus equikiangi]
MTNPDFSSDNDAPHIPSELLLRSEHIGTCDDYSPGHKMHYIRAIKSAGSDDWEDAEIIATTGHHICFATDSGIHWKWNHDPLFLWSRVNLALHSPDVKVRWSDSFNMLKISTGGREGGHCIGLQGGPVTPCKFPNG